MSDVFLLSESQMRQIEPFFLSGTQSTRVNDRRVLNGIVYVSLATHRIEEWPKQMWRQFARRFGEKSSYKQENPA